MHSDILFVSATLEVGGSETKIVKVVNALARAGYSAGVAYLNPPETLLEKIDPNVPVTHLQRRGKYSIRSARQLSRLVGRNHRIVVSVNLYPLVYVLPAIGCFISKRAKAICLINTTDFVDGQWIWGHLYAPLIRRCDRLVFGCRAQQELWTKKYRLPAGRSTFIYNGVDLEEFTPRAVDGEGAEFRSMLGIPGESIVIGSVGRLAPEKNFDLLIHAAASLRAGGREAHVVVVGEGKERASLTAAASQAGMADRVIFPGALKDVRPAVSSFDIFVLPSRAVETFSNAALEAMAMRCPVVLSRIGGAAEMVEHGDSGFLFDVGDIEMLTDLLIMLYDSKARRSRMGNAARRRVAERFHFGAMLEAYKELLY